MNEFKSNAVHYKLMLLGYRPGEGRMLPES